jgi:hypothetical protein
MTLSHISQLGKAASDPLLLYLHGAGEVGGDTAQQLRKSGPWANALYDPRNAYRSDTAAALSRFHVLAFICRREIGTVRRWRQSLPTTSPHILPSTEGGCS